MKRKNGELQQGDTAPDFELEDSNGNKIKLSDYRGQYIVLYFYPKDNTPGCTREACDFRDEIEEFSKLNALILGISFDPIDSHKQFKAKFGLPFRLLSDIDKFVAEKYEVFGEKKLYGRKLFGIIRSTFIIDPEGIIVKIWKKVKLKGHIEEVLTDLKKLTE
ncbi:thioredoxin-dependent thiol peroxidase [Candidatus Dependentiae bacterium]|nr:thioredoxin-dependent thiol peroxidase [Candidatus Dependentiae bacterium]